MFRYANQFAFVVAGCSVVIVAVGCHPPKHKRVAFAESGLGAIATQIEYPDIARCNDDCEQTLSTMAPITLSSDNPPEFQDIELQEAVSLAMQNSKVLRDLGGSVLQTPNNVSTIFNPAIQDTDPRFGVEGALSAFDTQFATRAFFEKNDRALNNQFFGGGTRLFQQDLIDYSMELSKRSAVGTLMTARHNMQYDFNNAPGNDVPNKPWSTNFEVEMRQPLLYGAGVNYNRIAGPGATPGIYNGVLIARVNTDISLADFEAGVRDLVNDVETAYWELHYAYRDLDAKIAARDRAQFVWREIKVAAETDRKGGEADKEARAREQYFRLEAEVQNALSGRDQERSRVTTFRGVGGIQNNERRLRLMTGLPISDGTLLRPTTEPVLAEVHFHWDEILAESLTRRVEIRQQKWRIKRRELELCAAKCQVKPQLDVIGRYRWRGLGHDLIDPQGEGNPPFNDAFQNLFDGNFQEWQLGAEFRMPVGLRQANAAVRNAKLQLHRAHAILDEQEREVTLELSNAIGEKDRAYRLAQTNLNRRHAAQQTLDATNALYEEANASERTRLLDLVLDAQRRLADSDSQYYRSLMEYMMAIKRLHYAKGSLLDYNSIRLAEGPWPGKAYDDAGEREHLRVYPQRGGHLFRRSHTVTQGEYPQHLAPPIGNEAPIDALPEIVEASPAELVE